MSFQAYLDNIKAKTGKTPEDFKKLAEKMGLFNPETKAKQITDWLKKDYDLGHGHAMAIYTVLKGLKEQKQDPEGLLNKHFSRDKEKWRSVFDALAKKLYSFGNDVKIEPVISYINILRSNRKFAIVQITKNKLYIGIKLKNQKPNNRFEHAGKWNEMISHKVSLISSKELDSELFSWLHSAYVQVKLKRSGSN